MMDVTVSGGQWAKRIRKVSATLAESYQALLDPLPTQLRLNVDETGYKNNGRGWWT